MQEDQHACHCSEPISAGASVTSACTARLPPSKRIRPCCIPQALPCPALQSPASLPHPCAHLTTWSRLRRPAPAPPSAAPPPALSANRRPGRGRLGWQRPVPLECGQRRAGGSGNNAIIKSCCAPSTRTAPTASATASAHQEHPLEVDSDDTIKIFLAHLQKIGALPAAAGATGVGERRSRWQAPGSAPARPQGGGACAPACSQAAAWCWPRLAQQAALVVAPAQCRHCTQPGLVSQRPSPPQPLRLPPAKGCVGERRGRGAGCCSRSSTSCPPETKDPG